MNQPTRTISLELASPGMVLAEAVRQNGGDILLPAAIELGESHLASLRKRGVKDICIVVQQTEDELANSSGQRQALQEAISLQVQHLFRKSGTDATTQALAKAVLEYRLEKIK